jgi:ribosomal protein S18 acetylase RimI-like enzyme
MDILKKSGLKLKIESFESREVFAETLESIKEIFYLTSNQKTFANNTAKDNFFYKWAKQYLEKYPKYFFTASIDSKDSGNSKIVGYLACCNNTQPDLLSLNIQGNSCFEEELQAYPAHLHINCHPNYQGFGVGSLLIDKCCKELSASKVSGVYIITSLDAVNVRFYKSNSFARRVVGSIGQQKLLFMGRDLDKSN